MTKSRRESLTSTTRPTGSRLVRSTALAAPTSPPVARALEQPAAPTSPPVARALEQPAAAAEHSRGSSRGSATSAGEVHLIYII